jgi:hypothetical protein
MIVEHCYGAARSRCGVSPKRRRINKLSLSEMRSGCENVCKYVSLGSTSRDRNFSGGTVTLRGGQFIHYSDANFSGTMYVTNSAAGCQRTGPFFDFDNNALVQVTATFSRPVPEAAILSYNLLGPPGMWEGRSQV